MNLDKYIDAVLKAEGGYTNDLTDNGGPTNFGITEVVARANGYLGDMKDMPESVARAIYLKRYITGPGFDLVAKVSEVIAGELIDTGVNMGPAVAGIMFQRWLNAFNTPGSGYADLFVDGKCGSVTLQAFGNFLAHRGTEGEAVMLVALNSVQATRYLEITEHNPAQRKFTYGWVRERVLLQLKGLL